MTASLGRTGHCSWLSAICAKREGRDIGMAWAHWMGSLNSERLIPDRRGVCLSFS